MEGKISFDVTIFQAQKEYIESINKVTQKYNLPNSIVELIISNIYKDIKEISDNQRKIEIEEYNNTKSKYLENEISKLKEGK